MSFKVHVQKVSNLPGKGKRQVQIKFRGLSAKSEPLYCGREANFNEIFEWQYCSSIQKDDYMTMDLLEYNKLTTRFMGTVNIIVQQAISNGRICVEEMLVDKNNLAVGITVSLEITYVAEKPMKVQWKDEDFEVTDRAKTTNVQHKRGQVIDRLKGMFSSIPGSGILSENDENIGMDEPQAESEIFNIYRRLKELQRNRLKLVVRKDQTLFRPQHFQFNITVHEATQLIGANINPVVYVEIDGKEKHTCTQKSTNCPEYNTDFFFEFMEPPDLIMDKIIQISVYSSGKIPLQKSLIGMFKIDVSTVYEQQGHMFRNKWAILTNPKDITAARKGYVKCDIIITRKGDSVQLANPTNNSSNIEKNLMLPKGIPAERLWSYLCVRIYKAEGLPKMNSGLVSKIIGDSKVFIDPKVLVTFMDQQGETSVVPSSSNPVWNEQVTFMQLFPVLCRRIQIQVLDDANISDTVLATHFIYLKQISDDGPDGFLPTFGPAWVNLYGSSQNSTVGDDMQGLNEGLGEAVFYRGRLLLAVSMGVYGMSSRQKTALKGNTVLEKLWKKMSFKTKVKMEEDSENTDDPLQPTTIHVEVEDTHPLPKELLGKKEDFLLLAAFLEVSMIDKTLGPKPIRFELSIGNYGKREEGSSRVSSTQKKQTKQNEPDETTVLIEDGPNEEVVEEEEQTTSACITPPFTPVETEYESSYYCLPFTGEKPCLHIWSRWEDHNWRMYNTNALQQISQALEEDLIEVDRMLKKETPDTEQKLHETLEALKILCRRYLSFLDKVVMMRTNALDRARHKSLGNNIEKVLEKAGQLKRCLHSESCGQILLEAKEILEELHWWSEEPQNPIPDVLIWMFSNNKRVAYMRIPAHSILFSVVQQERGRDCGKIQTIFLKSPGLNGRVLARMEVNLWFGLSKYARNAISSFPVGLQPPCEQQEADTPGIKIPTKLISEVESFFQMRVHLYQARNLLAADDSGLSDPYATVTFSTFCQSTKVIHETLSPTWNQTVVFDHIRVEGSGESFQQDPPPVCVEIYDQDRVGASEYMGQCFITPLVFLEGDQYVQPRLHIYGITKGLRPAGELLAVVEIIELDYSAFGEPKIPPHIQPQELQYHEKFGYAIPESIQPVLEPYRIEVLFWGLRDLKHLNILSLSQPAVEIECRGEKLQSCHIENYKTKPNFSKTVDSFTIEIPEEPELRPPLTIVVTERRLFGGVGLIGTVSVPSLEKFICGKKMTTRKKTESHQKPLTLHAKEQTPVDSIERVGEEDDNGCFLVRKVNKLLHLKKGTSPLDNTERVIINQENVVNEEDENALDWWSKFHISKVQVSDLYSAGDGEHSRPKDAEHELDGKSNPSAANPQKSLPNTIVPLKIFYSELEKEFDNFEDWLHIFSIYKGKSRDEFEEMQDKAVGKFKGSFCIYLAREAQANTFRITEGIPPNSPIQVVVRVYVIQAMNLTPADSNGKADPYVTVKLGKAELSSKERYIPKQLNPMFGEFFEFTADFPTETELTVQVLDHDLVSSDDLIGETKIDIENRFYSRHYACCGLQRVYCSSGYNKWRDARKPTQILAKLCTENRLPDAIYDTSAQEVKIDMKVFHIPDEILQLGKTVEEQQEIMALYVLQQWELMPGAGVKLVPEHVEVRALYNADKPGLEQGKVLMWVDLFPKELPVPPPVNVSPRKPESYELRVIIWNTEDVILDDVNPVTGTKSSDIYVKGWIKTMDKSKQETDVHFSSFTGEGNFNWRFIFRFDYLSSEKKIVYRSKESVFSLEETEYRVAPILILQVWDYDLISANDFLGSIEIDLTRMVTGIKTAKQCSVKMAVEGLYPTSSLFKKRREKGWWPFTKVAEQQEEREEPHDKKTNKKKKKEKERETVTVRTGSSSAHVLELTGKVEVEFELLTSEEAEKKPAGEGRKEPQPLHKPNRPHVSMTWITNPIKTLCFYIWRNYKCYLLSSLGMVALASFLVMLIYTFPGSITSKILNG